MDYIQILKALDLFKPRERTLKVNLSPEDANFELSKVSEIATEFSQVATEIAKSNSSDTKESILKIIKNGKFEILQSAIAPELNEKYKIQLRSFKDYEKLKTYLESIFKSQLSKNDIIKNARRSLEECVRFSKDNETFDLFLSRLTLIAEPLKEKSGEETANIFVRDAFFRNIPPQIRSFLSDHGKSDLSTSEIAKFLDEREKYRSSSHVPTPVRTDINNVDSFQNPETRGEKSEIEALKEQVSVLIDLVQTSLNPKAPEINKVGVSRPKAQNRPNDQRRLGWKSKFSYHAVRCQECGLLGHSKENCPKTCRSICHKCGKLGHLQAVCRSSKNAY